VLGAFYRFTPDPTRYSPWWCVEGIAEAVEVRGEVVLRDTYWGSHSDAHYVTDAERPSLRLLFDAAEFDLLEGRGAAVKERWRTYAEADRRRVTAQHGLQASYYVRKGAQPDLVTKVANAREAVAEARRAADSAEQLLRWKKEELQTLLAEAIDAGVEIPDEVDG
jgi:hypothetical protein